MALSAYIDGSGTGDPKHLVLAGYIAAEDTWIEFSNEWKAQLDEAGLPYFKMHEQAARPEIAAWFYRIIEKYDVKAAVSCVIHTDELVRANRSIKYPPYIINTEQIENPYYFGFKAIIDVLAQNQQVLGIGVRDRLHQFLDFLFKKVVRDDQRADGRAQVAVACGNRLIDRGVQLGSVFAQ
jgi:hypothetical protein